MPEKDKKLDSKPNKRIIERGPFVDFLHPFSMPWSRLGGVEIPRIEKPHETTLEEVKPQI